MRSTLTFLFAAALAVAGCGGSDSTSPGTGSGNNTPVATNAITVGNNFFSPSIATVAVGTTVTWTWDSGITPHNVTFSDGAPGSGDLTGTATFNRTFNTVGTFNYQCTIHGSAGQIIVHN